MSNKTIFGLPVDILSASNMTFTSSSAPDGKYVLKARDSTSGILMEGGADIEIKDGGGIEITGGGELSVDGKTRLHSTLWVDGKTTCDDDVLVQSNLAVSGYGVFTGDLTTDGDSYVAGLSQAPGGATIGDELEATGKSHFYGDVKMDTKLDVKGRATFDEFVEFYNDVSVHKELYVQQNAYITGGLAVNGTISSNKEAKVTGLISAESPIDVEPLAADPKVAVDVVASVSTDPVTVLTDVKQDTISSAPSTAGWSFTVGSSLSLSRIFSTLRQG